MKEKLWYILESAEEQVIGEFDHNPFDDWEFKVRGFNSGSSGYDTKEELWQKRNIQPEPCIICKRWIQLRWVDEVNKVLMEKNMCFGCNFWDEKLQSIIKQNSEGRRKIIVHGNMYSIAADALNDYFRGFGGAKFEFIRLATGEPIVSYNTWYNGEIPWYWLPVFPDNALMKTGRIPGRMII